MEELTFEVPDKDGILVFLATSRWTKHILFGHPDVSPFLEQAKQVIASPNIVTAAEGIYHFASLGIVEGKWKSLYLEVVIRYDGDKGEVLTIHFNGTPPKGDLKWMNK